MRALCYETVRMGDLAMRARNELTEFERAEKGHLEVASLRF
jgi:hypothetical protein